MKKTQPRNQDTAASSLSVVPPTLYQRSPINITGAITAQLPDLKFQYSTTATGWAVPAPHGYEIRVGPNDGKLTLGDLEAELIKLHFHSRSEHHIDDKEFAIELHLVHRIVRPLESLFLVVGVLFDTDTTLASTLGPDKVNRKKQKKSKNTDGSSELADFVEAFCDNGMQEPVQFNLNTLLPKTEEMRFKYFRYEGSLTTGELKECVSWVVLNDKITCIESEVAKLIEVAEHEDLAIQDLNRRFILKNF